MSSVSILSADLFGFMHRGRFHRRSISIRKGAASAFTIAACLFPSLAFSAPSNWNEAYIRATSNNWDATPMTYDEANSTWSIRQTFGNNNPRLKITHFNNWDEAYPDDDFLILTGAGEYDITFDDATKDIQAQKIVQFSDPISENSICFDNPSNFTSPTVYFWNPTPVNALTSVPQWPGSVMAKVEYAAGIYYCYNTESHLTNAIMPQSLNLIFNDAGANKTQDLLAQNGFCYQNGNWETLGFCGIEFIPTDPVLIAEAGDSRTIEQGDSLALTASGSEGTYTTANWMSDAWNGTFSGANINTPPLNLPGTYTVTLTIQDDKNTTSTDSFTLTVTPKTKPVTSTSLCFDNTQNFTQPHLYYWAPTPAGALNTLPQWPGIAMTKVGEHYCLDLAPYITTANTLPTSLNVIFNDNGSNKTNDLTFNADTCYKGNTWVSLASCNLVPEVTLIAEAGNSRSVNQGTTATLSASGSQGAYTSATWTSTAWSGSVIGSPVLTPALNISGAHTVTLTLSNGTTTAQDTFALTINKTDTGHGMNQRPELQKPLAFPISGNVTAGNYRFEKAFPNLERQFTSPVMIVPDGINDLIFVVDKPGSIFVFPNKATVTPDEVREILNIQPTVRDYHEQGLLSMAFDPDYASNGFIYIYYIQGNDDNEQAPNGDYGDAILERWTVNNTGNPTGINPSSNVEILRVPQPGPDHKGGMMQFHAEDSYLYLSIGDGAYGHSAITSFPEVDGRTNNSAQDTTNLRGSIIRIQPLATPINNQYYSIPSDNPFVGVAGFRPEIYSYGHRNPWRWAFDTEAPYTLWQTEVGQAGFEEVNLIQKGKNYGWPVCEGTTNRQELGGAPNKNCNTDFEPPREGYLQPEGFSIIGGIVYRGNKLPGLTGRFIFGDYVTKKIWSVVDGEAKTLISDAFPENIVSFGTDLSGEELFVSTYGVEYGGNSTIYKVVDDDAEAAVIPATLFATGLFSDLSTLTPVSGVIEYDVNTEGWFDGAKTQHFVSIPNDTTIEFDAISNWALPIGSVVVKHLSVLAAGDTQKPFTTSVLFKQESGNWQAANYYWNAAGTDADLVTQTSNVLDGGINTRLRAVQAAADCGACHTGSGSKEPRALNTRQWNKTFDYNGVPDNQLEAFSYVGLFNDNIGSADNYGRYAATGDASQSTHQRARSYLATNCAHCHSSGFMDLRFDTPLADTNLIDTTSTGKARLRPYQPENSLIYIYQTTDGNRMPKGSRHTNPVAQTLFKQWINAADAQQVGIALASNGTRFTLGDTLTVNVAALLDNEFPVNNTDPVIWSSSNSSVINDSGLSGNTLSMTLNRVGQTTLSAQAGGYSAFLSITVADSNTSISRIEIAPSVVALGDEQQLVAFGIRNDDSSVNLFGEVSWEVTKGSESMSVNNAGLLTRTGEGTGVVQASYQGITRSLDVTQARQDFILQYNNSTSNWGSVWAYIWSEANGQVVELSNWPGIAMNGPNSEGIWSYTVDPNTLVNGEINVIFNNKNGQKTEDQIGINQASLYNNGTWQPLVPQGALSRLAVIAGSTPNNVLDFTVGSVVTVNADSAPLGTQFDGWSGDGVAYIISDPSQHSLQILIPDHGISLQAKFKADPTNYDAARTRYSGNCAGCHAANGSGGLALPLNQLHTTNRYTQTSLSRYISDFMPPNNAGACSGVSPGECAYDIAKMILNDKWSACNNNDAQCAGTSLDTRNLRLLTRTEYLNSVRDIFGIHFNQSIMSPVPADGTFRNYSTASTLVADNDRTLGFDLVANEVATTAINASSFRHLTPNCVDNTCVVKELGRKIFRRPLTLSEEQRYLALYDANEDGITVVQGLLMSPHFMYRSELGVYNSTTQLYDLNDYEIATLLAYTFWVTTPDETLLSAAQTGNLNIEAQAQRLLADPRSEKGLRRFASGWLINDQYPFPAISSASLINAFKEETIRFVIEGIRNNAAFNTLLTADYTYANNELAEHYGINATGDWTRATFPSSDPRSGSGLLGQGSFLASRASTVNPAPIKRGVYVREAIMCQEFPPPAAANFDISFEPSDSNRDATSRHTSDPACATCHQYIDGVGFGFERFDSSGLYRVSETLGNGQTQTVDASGSIKSLTSPETVLDPDSTSVPYFTVPELASLIADSGQGQACFSRQFYRYTVGRNESDNGSDEVLIRSYSQGLRNGGGMRDMLIDLTKSKAFGVRR